jgi:hypothetical protein
MEKTWCIHTGLIAQSVQCTLYTGQASSRSCKIAEPTEKSLALKCSLRHWKQIPILFIAPLPTAVRGVAESLKGSHRMRGHRI